MSINELDNTYTSMGLPNILREERRGDTPRETIIHPFISHLVNRVAKARPNWKLVTNSVQRQTSGPDLAFRFVVYEGGEELGRIWKDYNYGTSQDVVSIDNTRLSRVRKRGSSTRTKNSNKAFKLISSTFGAKSISELATEGVTTARTIASSEVNQAERRHGNALYQLTSTAQEFMLARWDDFSHYALGKGVRQDTIDALPAATETYNESIMLRNVIGTNNDTVVVLRGSEYIVIQKDGPQVLSQAQLSDYLKRCIGMLKLAEDKQFIPGVGVRANSTTFLVLPELKPTVGD
jgi:hypothetical protein